MSIKSLSQIIILLIIFLIIGSVYFVYFKENNNINEINTLDDQSVSLKADSITIEKETLQNKKKLKNEQEKNDQKNLESKQEKNDQKNLESKQEKTDQNLEEKNVGEVKRVEATDKSSLIDSNKLTQVEYLTSDKKGNRYVIIADSGKTDKFDKNILKLNNVEGKVSSDKRSDIFIVSDYAKYNSKSQKSFFYDNVVINFEDKQIDCDTFDLNLETNFAIAKGNVTVKDPVSIMKAGKITLDISTKDINIEPEENKKINLVTE